MGPGQANPHASTTISFKGTEEEEEEEEEDDDEAEEDDEEAAWEDDEGEEGEESLGELEDLGTRMSPPNRDCTWNPFSARILDAKYEVLPRAQTAV
jgi:hypothetical protein